MKRIICILLAVCLLFTAGSVALASRGETERVALKIGDTQWGHEVSITNCISRVADKGNEYYIFRVEAPSVLTILETSLWGTGTGSDTEGYLPMEIYNLKSWADYDVGDGQYWPDPIFLSKGDSLNLVSGIYTTNCVIDVAGEDFDFFVFFEVVDPLAGAAQWAIDRGLKEALAAGLILDEFIGNWTRSTNRLHAAEAIVNFIEITTQKTIEEIAQEKGFDMTDTFADTKDRSTTFLKASGISTGFDGVNYRPSGVFDRAQMVTMLGRMAVNVFDVDLSAYPPGSISFDDLPNWPITDSAVGWAVAEGVTTGTGARQFGSSNTLTNQETGVFLYSAYKVFSAD